MSTQEKVLQTYTIKEVSEQSGLPESTLRYYESIGVIDPVARDTSSKHRVYTDEDMNTIDAIACLNAAGMSIDDMRSYLDNRTHGADTAKQQIQLLSTQLERIQDEERFLVLREQYVKLKVSYWRAVESGNDALAESIGLQAKTFAKDLKFPIKVKRTDNS